MLNRRKGAGSAPKLTGNQHGRSNHSGRRSHKEQACGKEDHRADQASELAREAQAARKCLLKLRADTKKAIEAAKREIAQAVEAEKAALHFEKRAAKDKNRGEEGQGWRHKEGNGQQGRRHQGCTEESSSQEGSRESCPEEGGIEMGHEEAGSGEGCGCEGNGSDA
jgi:hypothetical protein